MSLRFEKRVSLGRTEPLTVKISVRKTGILLPYLSAGTLYQLLAYDSAYISKTRFTALYKDFTADPANEKFLADMDNLSMFGTGEGENTKPLNAEGLYAFAKDNKNTFRFKFCSESIGNFLQACIVKLKAYEAGVIRRPRQPWWIDREYPSNVDQLAPALLHNALVTGDIDYFIPEELWRVITSRNTFYVMRLTDNRFRGGSSRRIFYKRLENHDAFKSDTFDRFYGLYLLGDSDDVDATTLENDFFLQASKVLRLKKSVVERCKKTNDSAFDVDNEEQIQHILELCLLNPLVQYSGLIEVVTNTKVLELISTKEYLTFIEPISRKNQDKETDKEETKPVIQEEVEKAEE